MSYTRIAAVLTGASAYTLLHFYRPTKTEAHPARVEMRPTANRDQPSTFKTFGFLQHLLLSDKSSSHIFIASLHKQTLTEEQVLILATLAIKRAHIVALNALAGAHPNTLTKEWIEETLIKDGDRFTFSALLWKNAENKIPHLSYLFDTKNNLVIVEEDDKKAYCEARLYACPASTRIVTVDTEYYDPSFKIHT